MRYNLNINASDLKALQRKVRNLSAINQKGLSGALKTAGATYEVEAKIKAPVDTGNLRKNIGYDLDPSGKDVELFSNAPYSGFVEFGTRYQRAQPYFMPAIRKAIRQLNLELKLLINNAIR